MTSLSYLFVCFFNVTLSASLMAQQVKNLPPMQETQERGFDSWVRKISWRKHSNLLQYSCLENPMD